MQGYKENQKVKLDSESQISTSSSQPSLYILSEQANIDHGICQSLNRPSESRLS